MLEISSESEEQIKPEQLDAKQLKQEQEQPDDDEQLKQAQLDDEQLKQEQEQCKEEELKPAKSEVEPEDGPPKFAQPVGVSAAVK